MDKFIDSNSDEWFKGTSLGDIKIKKGEYKNIGKYYIEFLEYDEKIHKAKIRLFYDDIDVQPIDLDSGFYRIDNYVIYLTEINHEHIILKVKQLRIID